MSIPILTFFNNKGGVGKTSLVYHLAWMLALMRKRVVALDLDPQTNLTAAFIDENELDRLWRENAPGTTIYNTISPLEGVGDIIDSPQLKKITDDLYLLPGDIALSSFEDTLSESWPNSMGDNNLYRPLRILSAFWQVAQTAANKIEADIILVDIGPNLGAINRSVLIATDFVVIPLGADLFSLQGLKNLGPTLKSWRNLWGKRLNNWQHSEEISKYSNFKLPTGQMSPIGYLCQQYQVRLDRPTRAYEKWFKQIPEIYQEYVLGNHNLTKINHISPDNDPDCMATVKHYHSLIPMGQEHRKPIFNLTAADGAIGAHISSVKAARQDFEQLASLIINKTGI